MNTRNSNTRVHVSLNAPNWPAMVSREVVAINNNIPRRPPTSGGALWYQERKRKPLAPLEKSKATGRIVRQCQQCKVLFIASHFCSGRNNEALPVIAMRSGCDENRMKKAENTYRKLSKDFTPCVLRERPQTCPAVSRSHCNVGIPARDPSCS